MKFDIKHIGGIGAFVIGLLFFNSIHYTEKYLDQLGSAFWFFLVFVSLLIVIVGSSFFLKKELVVLPLTISRIIFFLFVIFFSVQAILTYGINFVPFHKFLWLCFFFLVVLELLFRYKLLTVLNISRIIGLLVLYEIAICFLQYFGVVNVPSDYFRVYGTLPNPNLSGMFLAISAPIVLYGVFNEKKPINYINAAAYWGILVAIVLLESRTALIGFFVSFGYFLFVRMRLRNNVMQLYKRINPFVSFFVLFLSIIIVISVLSELYSFKKESSESRIMIWKLSTELGWEKPMTGHGLMSFERMYNLKQAKYFSGESATQQEKYNSGFIQIAYNDYIQIFVEGGIIGLGLFLGLLGSLLPSRKNPPKSTNVLTFTNSGILSFFVMGIFNSVLMAIPVLLVFIMFIAIGNAHIPLLHRKTISIPPKLLALVFTGLGCWFFVTTTRQNIAQRKLAIASQYVENGDFKRALEAIKPYQKELKNSFRHWILIGDSLQGIGRPKQAIRAYNSAINFTSNPKLYRRISFCYSKLGDYETAIYYSLTASNIVPQKFWPKLDLMTLYKKNNEFEKCRNTGNTILSLRPKGKTDTNEMKLKVRTFLHELEQKTVENEN